MYTRWHNGFFKPGDTDSGEPVSTLDVSPTAFPAHYWSDTHNDNGTVFRLTGGESRRTKISVERRERNLSDAWKRISSGQHSATASLSALDQDHSDHCASRHDNTLPLSFADGP